uniref:Uncharacterized protein n=1 Tax=Ditylenchus dipsaci TaxID=166011 RepID=A0A915DBX4_9BILA
MFPKFPTESNGNAASSTTSANNNTISSTSTVPVWVYVIFRKNPSAGHEKMNVNVSSDGPVFWDRHVAYVFCCSCHFDKHERELTQLLDRCRNRVERVCLVDRPVDYPFLPDSFFSYMANALPKLQFVYLRELDLEKINRATVEKLSKHPRLKRNYEALQDFHNLPQLLVVKGEIIGLKAMIGDLGEYEAHSSGSADSSGQSIPTSLKSSTSSSGGGAGGHYSSGRLNGEGDRDHQRLINTPSPLATSTQ